MLSIAQDIEAGLLNLSGSPHMLLATCCAYSLLCHAMPRDTRAMKIWSSDLQFAFFYQSPGAIDGQKERTSDAFLKTKSSEERLDARVCWL